MKRKCHGSKAKPVTATLSAGYRSRNPNRQAFAASQRPCAVSAKQAASEQFAGTALMSTAYPVWCSLWPGRAVSVSA